MTKKIPTTIKDQELVTQRRGEIIDVATRLFLERGFHKTSIRDIARACPFNLASLYMYVASKEDILFLVAQQLIEEKAKAMAGVEISGGGSGRIISHRFQVLLPDRSSLPSAHPAALSRVGCALAGASRDRDGLPFHRHGRVREDRAKGH